MFRSEDSLLELVGAIHLGAAGPDSDAWPRALNCLSDALGGAGAIVVDHLLPETIADLACVRVAPEVPDLIRGRLPGPANPLLRELPRLPARVLLAMDQVMDETDPVHVEVHATLGMVGVRHVTAAVLDRSHGRAITMSVLRSPAQGSLTSEHASLLRTVLPHLTTAALVRRRLAGLLAAAEAPRAVLHALDRGVILVDAASRTAHANPVAARILTRRDGLALDRGGALVAARPMDTGRLRRAIAAAALAGAGRGLESGGTLALARPSGRPYVVQILPLPPEQSLPGVPHLAFRPEAALLVSDPESTVAIPEQRLRQAYGLTRAEAALAVRLVAGMSLREAARELGVSDNTAKAQLKAVFVKLDVDRQASLVRRVLGDLGGVSDTMQLRNGHW